MAKRNPLLILVLLFFCFGMMMSCQKPQFINSPVTMNEEREKLSLQYLKERHAIEQETPYITPKMVVVHWTGIPTLQGTMDVFMPTKLPGARSDLQSSSSLNVAAQFVVDRDGKIHQLLPENYFARHVIGLNYMAVGIENIGNGDDYPLTEAQLKSNVKIIRYLAKKYPIEYLIGHYEYNDFRGTELFKETDPSYRTEKTDPGEEFMRLLRDELADLALKGVPEK